MVNRKRCCVNLEAANGTERHLSSCARFDVDVVQRIGIAAEPGCHFQHNVILIQLGEHRRDQSLAECIVERIIDGLHADPEP